MCLIVVILAAPLRRLLRLQRMMGNASAAPTAPAMVVPAANERHYQEVSSYRYIYET